MVAGGNTQQDAKVWREVVQAYSYVLTWMGVSISVILFNKWLLAYSGFPFPIALTLWHMFFCSSVGFLLVRVLKVVKSHNMTANEYFNRVMPIGTRAECVVISFLTGAARPQTTGVVLALVSPRAG